MQLVYFAHSLVTASHLQMNGSTDVARMAYGLSQFPTFADSFLHATLLLLQNMSRR